VTRGDGTFLTYTQSRDLDEENGSSSSYCLRNAEGEILKKYFPFENENLGQWGLFSPFWKEEDQIYLVCPLNFTIFRFEDGEMEPWMQVDFGAASADFGKIKEEGEIDFDDLREGGTKVLKMDYLIHTGEYLAFSFFVDGETKFVIFDKDRETLYYSDVLYENGVLPKCQLQAFRNGRFLALVEPLDLIEFSKSYPHSGFEMKKPSESDNPYVLTFALAN
ncbi:MAG: 6-bladed beta-propeller, partial [Bacteroidales bacterium]